MEFVEAVDGYKSNTEGNAVSSTFAFKASIIMYCSFVLRISPRYFHRFGNLRLVNSRYFRNVQKPAHGI